MLMELFLILHANPILLREPHAGDRLHQGNARTHPSYAYGDLSTELSSNLRRNVRKRPR